MTQSGRATQRDRLVAVEFVLISSGLVLAYWLDHLAGWLVWAVGSAVIAGITLLWTNRGVGPSDGE